MTVHHSVVVANTLLMFKMQKLRSHFLSHFIVQGFALSHFIMCRLGSNFQLNTYCVGRPVIGPIWTLHASPWPCTGVLVVLTFVWRLNVYVRYVYQHCMLLCQTISFYTALYLLSLCFILIWVWWCGRLRGRAVMHDARPSLFIFAVLCAVLRSGFRDTATQWCNCGQSVQIWCSVLLSVPEGWKIVLGNYNYPSRRDGHSMRTDAKNIIIFFSGEGRAPSPGFSTL